MNDDHYVEETTERIDCRKNVSSLVLLPQITMAKRLCSFVPSFDISNWFVRTERKFEYMNTSIKYHCSLLFDVRKPLSWFWPYTRISFFLKNKAWWHEPLVIWTEIRFPRMTTNCFGQLKVPCYQGKRLIVTFLIRFTLVQIWKLCQSFRQAMN